MVTNEKSSLHGREPFREAIIAIPSRSQTSVTAAKPILLVEDSVALLDVMRIFLEDAGYKVLCATNAAEALALIRTHPHPLSLLITDVVMPGKSGRMLADQLHVNHPAMNVIFVSGYFSDKSLRLEKFSARETYLAKPFNRDALLRKVRESLASNRELPTC